ncbi:lmo0937 family membrane protein [Desulfonatronum lacustre]|uniref:lmo0937 family membrane protein n=1 Tax=Desulfonatronum lacustre TaxID=66849 RepID=UPI0012EC9323|nr:lmo0937 family membrane protein [Desulfonatronum lacustre]
MLWTIFGLFLGMWLLGLIFGYTAGGLVHVLLVVAVIVMVIQLLDQAGGANIQPSMKR